MNLRGRAGSGKRERASLFWGRSGTCAPLHDECFLGSIQILTGLVFLVASWSCNVDFSDNGQGLKDGTAADVADAVVSGDGAWPDGTLLDGTLTCGNGILDQGEECDGTEFGGRTCLSETGFSDGSLLCTADCRIDASGCHTCGNGSIEGPEECEGEHFQGADCAGRTGMENGELVCTADCRIDDSGCHECGDGLVTGSEECDDGGTTTGDGCSASCEVESGYGCSGQPSVCVCTVYVDASGPSSGNEEDGSDWDHAFRDMVAGILEARDRKYDPSCQSKAVVWVAQGRYGVSDTLRTLDAMEIYGGFSGDETRLEQRNSDASLTVVHPGAGGLAPLVEVGGDDDVILDGLTFSSGVGSSDQPGAILVEYSSTVLVRNCGFVSNRAPDGGAVIVRSGSLLRVEDSIFEGNSASSDGGAIYITDGGKLKVFRSRFQSNTARRGGAIMIVDGALFGAHATVFDSNEADTGGAIRVRDLAHSPTLKGLSFVGNSSSRAGAALYWDVSGLPEFRLVRSAFQDNTWVAEAPNADGGLLVFNGDAPVILQDVLIADNQDVGTYPTEIISADMDVTLINVTVVENQAEAVFRSEWNASVVNSIIWSNHWSSTGLGRVDCRYSDIASLEMCSNDGVGIITSDPLFVDASAGDYHLGSGSPCIDAADGSVASDQPGRAKNEQTPL